jgi:hypothetical protein
MDYLFYFIFLKAAMPDNKNATHLKMVSNWIQLIRMRYTLPIFHDKRALRETARLAFWQD